MKISITIIFFVILPFHFANAQKHNIDKFAEFPGGVKKFYDYVRNNVKYPADAKRDSISGHVYVEFIIAADGTIKKESIRILKGLSPSCDADALRVIKSAPKWDAALAKDKAVEQTISFPVTFQFE